MSVNNQVWGCSPRMRFVYVAINPRQPSYKFYIIHPDRPTKSQLQHENTIATKFSKQTWADWPSLYDDKRLHNDFCMEMCKWTNCPDKPTLQTRSAYLPAGLCRHRDCHCFGNGRSGHASAHSCRNTEGSRMYTEWAWTSNQIHAARIHNFPCSPEDWNLKYSLSNNNVLWVGYIFSKNLAQKFGKF